MYGIAIIFLATLVAMSTGFFINLPSAAFVKQAEKCDQDKSNICLMAFRKSLDIPDTVDSSAQFFIAVAEYINRNGANGFVGLCSAGQILHICEGAQFDDCTSVEAFEQMGANKTDAYAYASFVGQVNYECGPGYDAYYRNGKCMSEVFGDKDYQKLSLQCQKNFNENIAKHPSEVCEYYQEYMTCLAAPLKKFCGNPAAFAFCNTLKSGLTRVSDYCDDLSCEDFKL